MENVTIDRLFRVHKPVEVLGRKLSVRALSGPEMQERERAALLAGLALDKRLRDPESDDYQVTLSSFTELEKPGLVAYLVASNIGKARNQAEEKIQLNIPPFPEGANDDEKRKVLESREVLEADYNQKINEEVNRLTQVYHSEYNERDLPWLLNAAQKAAKNNVIQRETNSEYAYYGVYLSLCDDTGKRYFSSSAEVHGLPNAITNLLLEYLDEVNKIDPLASNGASSTE